MLIDDLESSDKEDDYNEALEKEEFSRPPSYEDDLSFNGWQLSPSFPKEYSSLINKDAALGVYSRDRKDFNFIEQHLALAVYLNKAVFKEHIGYKITTTENEDGYFIEIKNPEELKHYLPQGEKILSINKVMSEKPIFNKAKHNKLSRAYTRMILTRGLGGQAAKDLKTEYRKKEHTLRDETKRQGIFSSFGRKRQYQGE
jgi:hypothetical protein